MKFSIIIACYNLGQLVCKAIDSCLNQRYIDSNDYEILVINDGSTDDTLDYIEKYNCHSNLRVINKPNGGLSNTRNLGIKEAQGDYVMFLDGDDWYSLDALHTLEKYIGAYDVIVFPMYYYYTEDNCIIKLRNLGEGEYSTEFFLHKTLGTKQFNIIPAQKKIYRRTFLLVNNISFMDGILHEDNPFFIDVMSVCKNIYFLSTPLYYYRQNRDGSITSKCTIRNFNGVMAGIKHIEQTSLGRNRDVKFLNGNMLVFQVVGDYAALDEEDRVYRTLRTWSCKFKMLKYLLTGTFDYKHSIRLLLLIIDPKALKKILKIYAR